MPLDAILLISVGELSYRKNHKVVVEILQELPSNYWYVVVGKGKTKEELLECDHTGRLKLLGYKSDIVSLLHASDLFVFPSFQEGLPVALMEAMASGLPVVCSEVRGNIDLVDEVLFNPRSVRELNHAILKIMDNKENYRKRNIEFIKQYDKSRIDRIIFEIYKEI